MNYEAEQKLSEWFMENHDLKRYPALAITNNIMTKWGQINSDTSIVKTNRDERSIKMHPFRYSYEHVIVQLSSGYEPVTDTLFINCKTILSEDDINDEKNGWVSGNGWKKSGRASFMISNYVSGKVHFNNGAIQANSDFVGSVGI